MKILLTIIFCLALSTSVYFISNLLAWIGWKINPENFNGEDFTNKRILILNIVMFISIILWSILFFTILLA